MEKVEAVLALALGGRGKDDGGLGVSPRSMAMADDGGEVAAENRSKAGRGSPVPDFRGLS